MRVVTFLLIAACAYLTGGASSAQQPSQPFLFGLWEGAMTVVPERGEGKPLLPPFQGQQYGFRLDIRDTNLVLYFQTDQGWQGMGEGADLRLNQEGRSAIVVAHVGNESWMVNVARWDEESIVAYLSRVRSAADNAPPASISAFARMTKVPR